MEKDSPPAGAQTTRQADPAIKTKAALLVLFALAWAASCIAPPYPSELILQHIPTVVVTIALVLADHRWRFSLASFAMILAFLSLHLLGARYLYSNVPYDDWARAVTQREISPLFDWERNHYDRLVHLAYGLLLVGPFHEGLVRGASVRGAGACLLAIACVLASSAGYELLEGLVAVTLSPEAAEAYNGQQGDMWDAQKDMALALGGAFIGAALFRSHQGPRDDLRS